MGVTTHKESKTPLFPLGCLIVIAVIMAMTIGAHGWNASWRQWWWMHTGHSLGTSAGLAATARDDASVLSFDNVKNGSQWTSVGASRAAGFRKGDIYCAAPILNPTLALGNIMRVEYWAIGINCCDDFGSFTCDASRETTGSVGVVMKGGGMPGFSDHADEFRLAALKACGVNNMVSAPGALYVRFVSEPKTIENLYLSKCIFSFFTSLLLGFVIFGALGFIVNYKAWGKKGYFPLYNILDHKRPAGLAGPVKKDEIVNTDQKWTLVLTPSNDPNGFNMSAMKPEEINYSTL